MFRQSQQKAIAPDAVAAFLLLDPIFPRSVRYCLERIRDSLQIVQGQRVPGPPDDLECLIGLVLARWSYTRIEELIANGLHEAIDHLQQDLNKLHSLIEQRYFIIPTNTPDSECEPA
jgi:uncharacterized alpha-E superfamily protein